MKYKGERRVSVDLPDLDRKVEAGAFSAAEGALIHDYMEEATAERGFSPAWVTAKYHLVSRIVQVMHENGTALDGARTKDIRTAANALRTSAFRDNYKRATISVLKNLALWLARRGQDIDPATVQKIKLPRRVWKTKTPEDMLTKGEVLRVIDACRSARDKALLAVCYDGGARPKELCDLNWSDVHFDTRGAYYITRVKTGRERRVRLTMSLPYLAAWKSAYPGSPKGDAPVFCTMNRMGGRHVRLNKDLFDRVVRLARDRSGVEKLKPGILRPTRITHDLEDGLPMQYVALRAWGTLKSQMLDVYSNISADYTDKIALEAAGISMEKKRPREKTLDPIQCECATINPPGSRFCSGCGRAFTEEAAVTREDLMRLIGQAMGEMTPEELLQVRELAGKKD